MGERRGAARDVAYVTYSGVGSDDREAPVVLDALARRGLSSQVVSWDDESVDWAAFRVALVRSAWDYTNRHEEFLAWARHVAAVTDLRNPLSVLERNTDKAYLRDFAAEGISVVPTVWVEPGEQLSHLPWSEVVVKPAVSAGARDTLRTADTGEAAVHVDAVTASGRTAMVQPYLAEVEGEGETSVIVLGGTVTHAVRRAPMLAGAGVSPAAAEARVPTAEQVAFAHEVLDAVPEREAVLYARVDMVRLSDGSLCLMELELTEPYLFLEYGGRSADYLAKAVHMAVH